MSGMNVRFKLDLKIVSTLRGSHQSSSYIEWINIVVQSLSQGRAKQTGRQLRTAQFIDYSELLHP